MRTQGLNLFQHFKIWFSTDRDNFLPIKNRVRLLEMRYPNPAARVSLIYSRQLLSPSAELELLTFSKINNITPIAYEDFKQSLQDATDLKVCECIDMEITAMAEKNPGACPAAASDMLRIIAACNGLGIYTDFDVDFDLRGLSDEHRNIESDAGMILPLIAKYGMPIYLFNNDFIAIPNPDRPEIQSLKETFIAAYQSAEFRYEDYAPLQQLSPEVYNEATRKQYAAIEHSTRLNYKTLSLFSQTTYGERLNPIELREKLHSMTSRTFCLQSRVSVKSYLETESNLPQKEFVEPLQQAIQSELIILDDISPLIKQLIISVVLATTGNHAISKNILQNQIMPNSHAEHQKILAFSLYNTPKLFKRPKTFICHVISKCPVKDAHELITRQDKSISGLDIHYAIMYSSGKQDVSWYADGKQALMQMSETAIQHATPAERKLLCPSISKQCQSAAEQCIKAGCDRASTLFTLSLLLNTPASQSTQAANQLTAAAH